MKQNNPKIIKVNANQVLNPLNEEWGVTAGFACN